jgi:hypothetical protein
MGCESLSTRGSFEWTGSQAVDNHMDVTPDTSHAFPLISFKDELPPELQMSETLRSVSSSQIAYGLARIQ